jgi:hypothetical protein
MQNILKFISKLNLVFFNIQEKIFQLNFLSQKQSLQLCHRKVKTEYKA